MGILTSFVCWITFGQWLSKKVIRKKHIVFLVVSGLLIACNSVTRLKVLNVLFDGVPQDTIPEMIVMESYQTEDTLIQDSATVFASAIPEMIYHEPYAERRCYDCHDRNSVGKLVQAEPDLCYSCHNDYHDTYTYLHGPVGVGFCSTCHVPHMSKNQNLLLSEGNSLCFPCHVQYEIKQPPGHVEVGDDLCVHCHNPHGENTKPRKRILLNR